MSKIWRRSKGNRRGNRKNLEMKSKIVITIPEFSKYKKITKQMLDYLFDYLLITHIVKTQ